MNVKLLITIPSLALLAACSGGSLGSLGEVSFDKLTASAQNAFLLSAEPGSVSLNGKMEINVSSIDATIGVNFDNSEVGSTVSITEGDYAGFVLTKVENVGGKPTMLVSSPNSYESTSAILGDLNTYYQSTVRFFEDVPVENEETLNGFTLRNETYVNSSTSSLDATSVGVLNGPSLVEAVITLSTIGIEETYALSAHRSNESAEALQYNSPESGGVYSYEGVAIVNGVAGIYTSENATMGINFTDLTGTFEADEFLIDGPPSSKRIKVTSILSIDNQYGIISSTSGKITVDESESPLAINGIIDFDNGAVAGAMIPIEETNGIVGGIFVVASTPP